MTPGAGIRVRTAQPTDLEAIGRLGALLVKTHHDFDPRRFIAATTGTEEGYAWFLGEQLQNGDAMVLVAEVDGKVAGYAYGGVEGHDWMALRGPAGAVYDVVVDPAHRRNGIGRMLLDAMMEALADRGVPRVVLSTAEKNEAAQQLFEGAGFRRTMVEMTKEIQRGFPAAFPERGGPPTAPRS